jgi:hypothetical protein
MAWLKQRSYGKGTMFRKARSCANETGRPWFVVYDTSERSYYAQSEPADPDRSEHGVATVYPKGWTGGDVPHTKTEEK